LARVIEGAGTFAGQVKGDVGLEVGGESDSPIAKFAGWLEDDPLYEPWQAAIAEYRRQRDESP
jgi:hypothetical protein